MENKRILLLGGGGHCKSVLDCLLASGAYTDIGIVDRGRRNAPVLCIPQVGTDEDLPALFAQGWTDAFITVGSVGNTALRRKLYTMAKEAEFSLPSVVDPTAIIAPDVQIPAGVFVGKRAVVNAGSSLGICAIINTGAVVEHDCHIGDFAHISPGTVLCGQVTVGADAHVGAGSVVRQQIHVGQSAVIGIGSAVTKDVPDRCEAYGTPCKVVKYL